MSDTYTYIRSEPELWTVGYHDPAGKWVPDSDHGDPEEAAARVSRLNGGPWVADAPVAELHEAMTAGLTAGQQIRLETAQWISGSLDINDASPADFAHDVIAFAGPIAAWIETGSDA